MDLQFLEFDCSEEADGDGSFDALASVAAPRLAALHAEIARVLGWAHDAFPGACAPPEDGGTWHYDLAGRRETTVEQRIAFDPATGRIAAEDTGAAPGVRHTVSLSIAGDAAFCAAFRDAFGLAD